MRYVVLSAAALLIYLAGAACSASQNDPYPIDWKPHYPYTYRDDRTRVTFYVESDGVHVSAIDASGKLRWVQRIPPIAPPQVVVSSDGRPLKPYKASGTEKSIGKIIAVNIPYDYGKALRQLGFNFEHKYVRVQVGPGLWFGLLDEEDGKFILEGSN